MDKSEAGHGYHSMHIDSGDIQHNIHSWRCGKNTKITFCGSDGPLWVDGTGYTCAHGNLSSAGRVDNPLTHYWSPDDHYWKSAGVEAYDIKKHGGPVKFTDVLSNGTCIGGTTLMPATDPS